MKAARHHANAMRTAIALIALATASAASAQSGEDAAHRADRLRTQDLNRRAAAVVAHRDGRNADAEDAYANARERYERRMEAWRRQVRACRAGDWDACR